MSTNKDRIPLPPVDAQKTLMSCHFCIVGCGYHVYKWDAAQEGGRAPHENALGPGFSQAAAAPGHRHDARPCTRSSADKDGATTQRSRLSGQGVLGQSRASPPRGAGRWRASSTPPMARVRID